MKWETKIYLYFYYYTRERENLKIASQTQCHKKLLLEWNGFLFFVLTLDLYVIEYGLVPNNAFKLMRVSNLNVRLDKNKDKINVNKVCITVFSFNNQCILIWTFTKQFIERYIICYIHSK